MNYIPFRVLFICIFLPPVLYLFSIYFSEAYFQTKRVKELEHAVIQDYEALYNGRYSVKEEIKRNIGRYFQGDNLRSLGVVTRILVTTGKGRLLYPCYDEEDNGLAKNREFGIDSAESLNYVKVAEKNFQILNDGINLSVDVELKHNSWFSNGILLFYLFASILLLYRYYRKSVKAWLVRKEDEQRRIDSLSGKLVESEKFLVELIGKEKDYLGKIEYLKHDKEGLESDILQLKDRVEDQEKKSLDMDEVLEEMERLDEQACGNIALKEKKEHEITELREEIDQLKKIVKKGTKKRKKDITFAEKRFTVIYKNLIFHERAVEGYLLLTPDFQLKAEEIIHRLNEDSSSVNIKRKLFCKKGKLNVLEVIFSYSGRVYFKKEDNRKTEILTIGTKNTQEQDIVFIEGL